MLRCYGQQALQLFIDLLTIRCHRLYQTVCVRTGLGTVGGSNDMLRISADDERTGLLGVDTQLTAMRPYMISRGLCAPPLLFPTGDCGITACFIPWEVIDRENTEMKRGSPWRELYGT